MPPRMRKPAGRTTKKHNEEETTKTRGNQKRKHGDIMDFSHSNSTTNLNNQFQSESWECPLSARRQLIPDSATIPSRRRSLRSSKRLVETRITCWPRCSLPHKSREHSPATDVIQHLDHAVDRDIIVSACQSPEGSPAESPPKYLKQVVYPSTFEPEMTNEETEKVGSFIARENFRVDIPEIMEEVGGAEKSLSNPSTHEKESFVEPISMAGRPSPSFSHKLTELVNMVDDEDDEVDSVTQTVDEYQVKPESMPILRKILSKHGDIGKNCTASTMEYRSALLEMVCDIISELKGKDFTKIKQDYLHKKIAVVNEIKNMKVDVGWLHLRLDEMLQARRILDQCGMLKEEKESIRKKIEDAESKLEECEERKREVEAMFQAICGDETVCKEKLAKAMDESSRINETVKHATSKVKRFLHCSPVDDLL